MTPERLRNLQRLLRPRHVALIGGSDADAAATECARIGFQGPVWPVNPKRDQIGGHACFASVDDLPEPPDAVFLAVPRKAAIDVLRQLTDKGAGGVVCYTAGFREMGEEGAALEAELIEAAGDMALVGPNCYGLINYLGKVALWPFAHGGFSPGYGAAIITQSGMLSSDLTMSQRSVPFAYMISAGNQSVLALEDFVDALCGVPEVRAFGLHIEGLKDVPRFVRAAQKALEMGKPIVALKTGSSQVGGQLTQSHTGSLSGSDELYSALFDKLGIIRVQSPAQLLETLKFLMVAGIPAGRRVAGLTCSGGGATMLADYGEKIGLSFEQPSARTAAELRSLLPHTATVSNPLDYTTPIWGDRERVPPVFASHLGDRHDSAVIVQDYPAEGLDEAKPYYLNDARSFVEAVRERGLPGAVCSTLPENIDAQTRQWLVNEGVAPMQGIQETLEAIAAAAWYGERASQIKKSKPFEPCFGDIVSGAEPLDEAEGKALLRSAGFDVPDGAIASGEDLVEVAERVGFPVVLKMVGPKLLHKTEAGAIALKLSTAAEVTEAASHMRRKVGAFDPAAVSDRYLIERMQARPVAELLVSLRMDHQLGAAMTIGSGGILVELVGDAETLLLPASDEEIGAALDRLKVSKMLMGYRGAAPADRDRLIAALQALASFMIAHASDLAEIEINPLFVYENEVCAVDVLLSKAIPPDRH